MIKIGNYSCRRRGGISTMVKAILSGNTYMKLLSHVLRFWNKALPPKDCQAAYGLLVGRYENDQIQIRDVEPILHNPSDDLEFKESFMQTYSDVNGVKTQVESQDRVIGWYRTVLAGGLKFTARDIRNQVKFQSLDPNASALLFDPTALEGSLGFSIFRLQGTRFFSAMSEYGKVPWEVKDFEDGDIDSIVRFFREVTKAFHARKHFIEEFKEVEEPTEKDDIPEFITPKPGP